MTEKREVVARKTIGNRRMIVIKITKGKSAIFEAKELTWNSEPPCWILRHENETDSESRAMAWFAFWINCQGEGD